MSRFPLFEAKPHRVDPPGLSVLKFLDRFSNWAKLTPWSTCTTPSRTSRSCCGGSSRARRSSSPRRQTGRQAGALCSAGAARTGPVGRPDRDRRRLRRHVRRTRRVVRSPPPEPSTKGRDPARYAGGALVARRRPTSRQAEPRARSAIGRSASRSVRSRCSRSRPSVGSASSMRHRGSSRRSAPRVSSSWFSTPTRPSSPARSTGIIGIRSTDSSSPRAAGPGHRS